MIPPPERHSQPSSAERRAEWEARKIADTVLNMIAGLERKGIPGLAVFWDSVALMLALMRREARNRGVAWEQVEDRLNADSKDWERRIAASGQIDNVESI